MAQSPTRQPTPAGQRRHARKLFDAQTIALLVAMAVMFGALAVLITRRSADTGAVAGLSGPRREYAADLIEYGLYDAAAAEYERVLNSGHLDANQQANLCFQIANLYKDDAGDYAQALRYYLRVRSLYPKSKVADQVGPLIVECLERLGKSADAQLELTAQTRLDDAEHDADQVAPGTVVAQIGERKITMSDLDKEIRKLPDYLRTQFDEPAKKLDFLKQYVATELMHDKAKRLNLDKDPEIVENALQVKKSLMVQKLLDQEVRASIKLTPEDLKLYYDAHKDQYQKHEEGKEDKQLTLLEAKDQVEADLRREREQAAQQKLLEELMRAEHVQLHPEAFHIELKGPKAAGGTR